MYFKKQIIQLKEANKKIKVIKLHIKKLGNQLIEANEKKIKKIIKKIHIKTTNFTLEWSNWKYKRDKLIRKYKWIN